MLAAAQSFLPCHKERLQPFLAHFLHPILILPSLPPRPTQYYTLYFILILPSQARTNGMRSLVEAVNRNLTMTNQLVAAAGGTGGIQGGIKAGLLYNLPGAGIGAGLMDVSGAQKYDQQGGKAGIGLVADLERAQRQQQTGAFGQQM